MLRTLYTVIAFSLRAYCRYAPIEKGKFTIWKDFFMAGFLGRKGLVVSAKSAFGATFRLPLGDYVPTAIFLFGIWEPVMTAYLMRTLKEGDIFIDIGANIGYYAALAGISVGSTGKVYAIEASPHIYTSLQETIATNKLPSVKAFNVAVTDKACDVSVWLADEGNLSRTTIVESMIDRARAGFEAKVRGLPLDQILPVQDILDARVIKIDVEGAEWLVLQGIKALLPRLSDRTQIFVEATAKSLADVGVDMAQFLRLFTDAGFEPWVVNAQFNEPYYPMRDWERCITPLKNELTESDQIDFLFRRAEHRA
jgi:FkbM family methyltransferase